MKAPDVDSKFKTAMEEFFTKIGKIIQDLEKAAGDIDGNFKDCLKFYGEPPATDAETFFGNIATFVAAFEVRSSTDSKFSCPALTAVNYLEGTTRYLQKTTVGDQRRNGTSEGA